MEQPDPVWVSLVDRLKRDDSWRTLFVLGAADSGKTTFCRYLGRAFAAHCPTAVIDCDPGQSAVGPPGTVALGWEPWTDESTPLALRFVGSTSPAGHFLPLVCGVGRLAERGQLEGATKLIFDSSGYMASAAGRSFHYHLLDLIRPEHLVVLQKAGELEPLLANFGRRNGVRIHRLPVSPAVRRRSTRARRVYRRERFARYFATAERQSIRLDKVGLHGWIPEAERPNSYDNRLIALIDQDGFVLTLGLVQDINVDTDELVMLAPPFSRRQISTIAFGHISLDLSGEEL